MLRIVLIVLSIFSFNNIILAQTAPVFCTGSDIDMTPSNDDCITTCKAVLIDQLVFI